MISRLDPRVRIRQWSLTAFLSHPIAHEQRAVAEVRAAMSGQRFEINHQANEAFNQGAACSSLLYAFETVHGAWLTSFAMVLEFVESSRFSRGLRIAHAEA